MNWLLLESYYDGSHRQLVDGLLRHVCPDAPLWTLPGRKWKWRMRGAALEFARRMETERPAIDGIFVTSLTNAAEFRGLLARAGLDRTLAVYFHENQLAYPIQHFDQRDHHFAWTNLHSALVADRLAFNSRFNLESFLEGMDQVIRKMPDARPRGLLELVRERAKILPVPIEDPPADREKRSGPCHIVWNHRREFDKGAETLLAVVRSLRDRDLRFRFSLLGQRFEASPPEFAEVAATLGSRLVHDGFVESRDAYWRILGSADVALSTAEHEFQGLAVLEGCAAGATPLVPDALAYRELFPVEWRYRGRGDLVQKLERRIREVEALRATDPRPAALKFTWSALAPDWQRWLGEGTADAGSIPPPNTSPAPPRG
jgi:glycosyltransferase involved in cell wall biosynthesis